MAARGGGVTVGPDLALATVDSWILWNLSGGPSGGVFATDVTNASRTMLFDIVVRRWSDELCDLFHVPTAVLPSVRPSCGRFAKVAPDLLGAGSPLAGVPVSALIGDQHAALFGQACFDRGMTKATFGTGSFILMNVGDTCPAPVDGLVTTLAWDLGTDGDVAIGADGGPRDGRSSLAYAVEGSVFVAGAGVQWLRDGLGIIAESAELEPLARSVDSSDGVVLVPAFTGLGSPQWDPAARGTITGLSRGTGRAHLARAMIEAMGFQVRDVLETMAASGTAPLSSGWTAAPQSWASSCSTSPTRPASRWSVRSRWKPRHWVRPPWPGSPKAWGSLDDLSDLWSAEAAFTPEADPVVADLAHASWTRSVDRSRGWAVRPDGD